jgi:hypothetical protein
MKLILGPFAAAILLVAAPAVAQPQSQATPAPATQPAALDPASIAIAQQILEIAFPPANRADMMASMMDSLVEQTRKNMENYQPAADKDFQKVLNRSTQRMFDEVKAAVNAALPDYFDSMARAYARDFSRDDLTAILAFVKTPAGQRYFERAPQLLKDPDVQAASQRMTAQMLKKMPEIQKETMRDVENYVAQKEKANKAVARAPVS